MHVLLLLFVFCFFFLCVCQPFLLTICTTNCSATHLQALDLFSPTRQVHSDRVSVKYACDSVIICVLFFFFVCVCQPFLLTMCTTINPMNDPNFMNVPRNPTVFGESHNGVQQTPSRNGWRGLHQQCKHSALQELRGSGFVGKNIRTVGEEIL